MVKKKRIITTIAFAATALVVSDFPLTAHVQASSLSTTVRVTAPMRPTSDYVWTHKARTATISDDGRYNVFTSNSNQLISDDTNNTDDVFIYDRQTKKREIVRGNSGEQPNRMTFSATISGDGRFVAFFSYATNLMPEVHDDCRFGCFNLYVYDRQTKQMVLANRSSQGRIINVIHNNVLSDQPVMSRDGRFVVFRSEHSLSPKDTNHKDDIMLRDLKTGVTQIASLDSAGNFGPYYSSMATVSHDGRFVTFLTDSPLVPDDNNDKNDVYRRDVLQGQTTLISRGLNNQPANNGSYEAAMSQDGRYITYSSWADNLVPGDANKVSDVFLHDSATGSTKLISAQYLGGAQGNEGSREPNISSDGRFIVYTSYATNLVRRDANNQMDSFIYDRSVGITRRVSLGSHDAPEANGYSHSPSISGDGKTVSFKSTATNLTGEQAADLAPEQIYMNHNPVAHIPYYDPIDILNL